MQMAVVAESILVATAVWKKVESKIEVRECVEEKERACTNVLSICVIRCCWDLQLCWSVGSGEETFAGIAAFVVENAGLRAECREILHFCRFHASTFCVICLWRREKFVGWCLASFSVHSRDFLLLLLAVVGRVEGMFSGVAVQRENC